MARILVTGAGGSAAHNFREALRLADTDHRIVGSNASAFHLELFDADARYLVPRADEPGYLDAINRIIDRERIDFLHPQPDPEVAFLAQHRHHLHAPTFLPETPAIALCQDKMACNTRLQASGVPAPRALPIRHPDDLHTALADLTDTSPRVWLRAVRGAGSRASLPIDSFPQGDAWIDYWRSFRGLGYGDFMASELLPGQEFAWQSLWHQGELVTSQARERVEYLFGNLTPTGQSSSPSVARTVNRSDVNATGESAVRSVTAKPHGVFCVDLKENSTGTPMVTEINAGRFFTTSNFFAHAGLNMPDMYVHLGLGESLPTIPKAYDPLPADLYWVRMMDMGHRLVKEGEWTANQP